MKFIRLALVICLLTTTALAQEIKLPPRGKYKHDKKIFSQYDKFKDKTTVSLAHLRLSSVSLGIAATFSHQGTDVKTPDDVALWFYSYSSQWRFLRNRSLMVIADGERLDLGGAARVDSKVNSGRFSGVTVSETLGALVPLDKFLKIANAKSVEMQLGNAEFQLAPDHLEALKDFASRMSP